MPLQTPPPPTLTVETLRKGLDVFAARTGAKPVDRSFSEALGGAPPQISNAHQFFVAGLDQISTGQELDAAAQRVGWCFHVANAALPGPGGAAPTRSADVVERDGQYSLAQINQGWITESTQKAVDYARTLPQVQAGSFELRALRLPALLLDTLWLKNLAGEGDLIVPIASKDPAIHPLTVIAAPEFLAYVRERARRKLEFNDRPLQNQ